MIYCESRRCSMYEDGVCKHIYLQINSYGRCTYFSCENDDVGKLIWYLEIYFSEYPFDWEKDTLFFRQVLDEFSQLNVLEELKRFRIWLLDRDKSVSGNYRSRFRNWLLRARERRRDNER